MINEEQISKFLNQECSPEETEAILDFFQEHPEELEKYISYREWEDFQAQQKISSSLSGALWSKVAPAASKKKLFRLPAYIKAVAVAACLATVIWCSFIWQRTAKEPQRQQKEVAGYTVQNTGTDTMALKLPDGTHIKLAAGSALSYSRLFPKSERNIQLQGWACFRVVHGTIPFVVHTGVLTIKDLGTIFSVGAFEKDSVTKVTLYEGCVDVSSVEEPGKSFCLKPGDILLYNKNRKKFSLTTAAKVRGTANKSIKNKTARKGYKPGFAGNNWYMFNNQPLSGVFDQLGKIYNVRIFYADSILHGMTFIGRLDKTDTLEEILRSIASLNNLKVEKTSEGYRIYK